MLVYQRVFQQITTMTVNMTMSMTMTMTIPCGFVDSNIQHISIATIVTLCVTMSTCRENSHTLLFSELFWWNPALGLFRPTLLIHKPIILRFIGILLKIHAGCELCLRMTLWWRFRMSCIILQVGHWNSLESHGAFLRFKPCPRRVYLVEVQ